MISLLISWRKRSPSEDCALQYWTMTRMDICIVLRSWVISLQGRTINTIELLMSIDHQVRLQCQLRRSVRWMRRSWGTRRQRLNRRSVQGLMGNRRKLIFIIVWKQLEKLEYNSASNNRNNKPEHNTANKRHNVDLMSSNKL